MLHPCTVIIIIVRRRRRVFIRALLSEGRPLSMGHLSSTLSQKLNWPGLFGIIPPLYQQSSIPCLQQQTPLSTCVSLSIRFQIQNAFFSSPLPLYSLATRLVFVAPSVTEYSTLLSYSTVLSTTFCCLSMIKKRAILCHLVKRR